MTEPHIVAPAIRDRLSEGILLGLVTVTGWSLALTYEAGYLGWFGVPPWFIRLNLERVLVAIGAFGSTMILFRIFLWSLPNRPWWAVGLTFWRPLFGTLFLYFVLSRTELAWGYHLLWLAPIVLPILFILIVSILVDVLLPLHKFREHKRWSERWKAAWLAKSPKPPTLVGELMDESMAKTMGYFFPLFLTFAPLALYGAYRLGVSHARGQQAFILVEYPKPCAAIRPYDEALICVDIDTVTRRVLPAFQLISSSSGPSFISIKVPSLRSEYDSISTVKLFTRRMGKTQPN